MPNYKSISKTSNNSKLFVGDKMKIKELVKEYGKTDTRFQTESATIRYLVHLGITSLTATEDLNNSLNNSIIKKSITASVRDEVSFHSAHIEKLQNMIAAMSEKMGEGFQDMTRRTEVLEGKIDGIDLVILKLLNPLQNLTEYTLRNILILRSVIYLFLLGFRTGRVNSKNENLQLWYSIIQQAHEKAQSYSIEEIQSMTDGAVESKVIVQMATEIYSNVKEQEKSLKYENDEDEDED